MELLLPLEGAFEANITDDSSHVASLSSTPPTTVADEASIHSASPKQDVVHVALDVEPIEILPITATSTPISRPVESLIEPVEPSEPLSNLVRPRRSRVSAPVYNLVKLSGTAGHGKRRANGDIVSNRRRRRRTLPGTIATDEPISPVEDEAAIINRTTQNGLEALDLRQNATQSNPLQTRSHTDLETPVSTRRSSRKSMPHVPFTETPQKATPKSGKRNGKAAEKASPPMSRELRRLQDTKEFAHVDDRPVLESIWSNGKWVDPKAPPAPKVNQKRTAEDKPEKEDEEEDEEEEEEEEEEEKEALSLAPSKRHRQKKWLDKGLYAGQPTPKDFTKGFTPAEKKTVQENPNLMPKLPINKVMPPPMFSGHRTLIHRRDFKLPFNICSPQAVQPKPHEWKKMTKNRFIGESRDYWRKSPHFHDGSSKCVCKPEDGCGESCQNRIMLYECDAQNCNVGKELCTNRAFAELAIRKAKGGPYRIGVEVVATGDRGHGIRANRGFEPGQIIMEYAGEIITEAECERRMTEVYKNNECYYLMSFDQNMIIDATTGSIARFVNHSCNPNCRMIKWIVSGMPRMALFAGDKPITTGQELTYDYNFDPFSAKNVQKCLCGEDNCRGVLGPKPREVKLPKSDLNNVVKGAIKAGKRKLKEFVGDEDKADGKAKKRKVQATTSAKRALSNAGTKLAKGAVSALRKGVANATTTAKKAALGSKSPAKRRASTTAILKKATTKRSIQAHSARTPTKKLAAKSTVTLIAAAKNAGSQVTVKSTTKLTKVPAKVSSKASPKTVAKAPNKKTSPAKQSPATKGIVAKAGITKTYGRAPRRSMNRTASPRKALELTREAEIRVVQTDN